MASAVERRAAVVKTLRDLSSRGMIAGAFVQGPHYRVCYGAAQVYQSQSLREMEAFLAGVWLAIGHQFGTPSYGTHAAEFTRGWTLVAGRLP